MYDEKTKARNIRSLQKNFEQVRLTVKKGTLAKYKAFAERNGMSMTAYITSLMEREMENDAEFCAEWSAKVEAEQTEIDAAKQDEISRIKSDNAAAMREGMKK